MINRSANATIKGYFYQFDHAVLQLLTLTDENSIVSIEDVEDVDVSNKNFEELIQCKYYEQTEYNHSVIKPAVIAMLRHFSANGASSKFHYKLYGHYESGHQKLVFPLSLDFVKNNLLKYEENKVLHEVWVELSIDDIKLQEFINMLKIDNQARSYDEQMDEICRTIKQKIVNSTDIDPC